MGIETINKGLPKREKVTRQIHGGATRNDEKEKEGEGAGPLVGATAAATSRAQL